MAITLLLNVSRKLHKKHKDYTYNTYIVNVNFFYNKPMKLINEH
jgi:hypothetical protein